MNDGQRPNRNRQSGFATTFVLMHGAVILADPNDRAD